MKTAPKLLIVDDEIDLLETLAETLESNVDAIVKASNGKEALETLQADPSIVAVLSDINMPVVNGLELIKTMRERGLAMPFVFLTGYADKEKAVEALRFGAFDFLEKPFDRTKLRDVVGRAFAYGIELHSLDLEIDAMARKFKIPNDQLEKFRKMQRELLILQKQNKTMFPKVG